MKPLPTDKLSKLVKENNLKELEAEISKWLDEVEVTEEENPAEQLLTALKSGNDELRNEIAVYDTLIKMAKKIGESRAEEEEEKKIAQLKNKIGA